MNPKILLLLSCLGFTGTVDAQSRDNSPDGLNNYRTPSEAAIYQEMQRFVPVNSTGNLLELTQRGHLNSAAVAMTGQGLGIAASQIGTGNLMEVSLEGANSRLLLSQQGNFNNMILSKLAGSESDFQALQYDNFNSLEIDGAKSGALPSITIEQRGGMHLIIDSPSGYHVR